MIRVRAEEEEEPVVILEPEEPKEPDLPIKSAEKIFNELQAKTKTFKLEILKERSRPFYNE